MMRYVLPAVVMAMGAEAFSVAPLLPANMRSASRLNTAVSLRMNIEQNALSRRAALASAASASAALLAGTASPSAANAEGATTATLKLNTFEGVKGDVVLELYPDKAPKTVAAFKQYADSGLYDKTAFFRVAKFQKKAVLVGGDPYTKEEKICVKTIEGKEQCSEGTPYGPDGFLSTGLRTSRDDNASARKRFGKGGPDGWRTDGLSKVKLEPEFGKVPHEKGVISLRRFANPDSAGSQFIISMGDLTAEMDGQYAAFGKVVSGIELLEEVLKSNKQALQSEASFFFYRDDKKQGAVWPAYDLPSSRQGIDSIVVK